MPRYLPVTLAIPVIFFAANVSAEERMLSDPAPFKGVADCAAPSVPENSDVIVLKPENGAGQRDDVPLPVAARLNTDLAKSYARADKELLGYLGPGSDGLRTLYHSDPSDQIFGPNPISQMSVI